MINTKYQFILIGIIALVLVIVGFYFFSQKNTKSLEGSNVDKQTDLAMMKKQPEGSEGKMMSGYSGKVLAGKDSPYLEFTKNDYDKALASGKIVVLDFYANWCPICRAEAPEITSAFDSLQSEKVIGFRVNFNDSETDGDEKALALQFKVPYQHTKIILKNGQEVDRIVDSLTKDNLLQEINKFI
ncbi:redoxin domain-containing protein [Candidatus Daviesbacteria bacterium]|nr:redoxin domain-containing protein [Candidatus Daviesbacteria bacterium]